MTATRRWWATLAAICGAGMAVRLWFVLAIEPPIQEISDAGYYHLLGKHLTEGEGYVRPYDLVFFDRRTATAEFPPLLPLLLAGCSLLGIDTMLGQRVVLCLLGGVTILLVGHLGRRMAGPLAGLVAAGLVAVHPMIIGADASLMTEGLGAMFTAAILAASLLLLDRPGVRPALLLGATGGAMALLRGEGAVLLAGAAGVALLVLARRHAAGLVRIAGGIALAAGVVVAPWLVRNAVVFDGLVLSNNLGSVLAGSYCDETFEGPWVGFWRISPDCFWDYGEERGLNEAEGAAEIRGEAVEYAREHLDDMPRVAAIRVARLFGVWDLGQQVRLAEYEARDPRAERAGTYLTWLLVPLAAAGAVAVARRREPGDRAALALLAVPVASAVAMAALTYGNQRFRIGADVVFVILTAALVGELVRRRRERPSARVIDQEAGAPAPR